MEDHLALSLMEPISKTTDTRDGNLRRVDELVDRLDVPAADRDLAREVCKAFDVAAEFAACEGLAIREALAGFFEEAEPVSTRWGWMQEALRQAVQWGGGRPGIRWVRCRSCPGLR